VKQVGHRRPGSRCAQAQRSIPTSRRLSLSVPDEHGAAVGVEVGLVEHKRFADPQPGAPEHYDHAAQRQAVGTVSGSADDGDDLVHGRRFGWVPTTLIAWRNALLEAGGGRGRAAPTGAVQQRYRFIDVLLWTMVDAPIVPAQLGSGPGYSP